MVIYDGVNRQQSLRVGIESYRQRTASDLE